MKISIVVPCYNEELVIKDSVEALLKNLESLKDDWELIIVNDGSTDGTLNILNDLRGREKNIKIVSYMPNRGRGRALRAGFEAATGDIIVTTEADSSWGKDIVLRLVSALKNNSSVDVVIASPHMKGGGYINVPFFRRLLSLVANKIITYSMSEKLTMVTGMARAYRKEVIDSLELTENGKEVHLEIISKVIALGYEVKEIPVTLTWKKTKNKNKKRKSSFNIKKLVFSHLMFTFNETPFILIGSIGIIAILFGLISGLYIIYMWLNRNLNPERPLIILSVLLIVFGLQALLFSFLANQNREMRKDLIRITRRIKGGK